MGVEPHGARRPSDRPFLHGLSISAHPSAISGDTVWYDEVAEVARRFQVHIAALFMGAARVREVSPHHVTMTAEEGVEVARLFRNATIVPLHFEGWAHFSESRETIARTFAAVGLDARLRWLEPGAPTVFRAQKVRRSQAA